MAPAPPAPPKSSGVSTQLGPESREWSEAIKTAGGSAEGNGPGAKMQRVKVAQDPPQEEVTNNQPKRRAREETLGQLYSKEKIYKDRHPNQILPQPVPGRETQSSQRSAHVRALTR